MSAQHDPDGGDGVDRLEVAPAAVAARRLLLVTVALLVLALVLVVAVTRSQQGTAPAPSFPGTPEASTPPGAPTASGSSTGPTRPTPTPGPDEDVGGPVRGRLATPPWPGAGASWELFGQDSRHLYRVRLATGELTRTPVRIASAPGTGSTFVAGPDGVLVRSAESSAAAFVPDDGPAVDVGLGDDPEAMEEVLPGSPGLVWVLGWDPDSAAATARRFRLAGSPAGAPVAVTGSTPFGGVVPDGAGGLLLQGVGGTWELADPPRRVTRGAVLATGPRAHVYVDCDAAMDCSRFVRDVGTDRTRRLGPAADGEGLRLARSSGQTSPDGRRAVLPRPSEPVLDVVDLATGEVVAGVSLGSDPDPANSFVWSPDSRYLLVLAGDGVSRVDVVTGERTELPLGGFGQGLRRLALRG